MRSFFKFIVITFFTTFVLYANDTFIDCSDEEIKILHIAHENAIVLAKKASNALASPVIIGERYTTWFGEPNLTREITVSNNFKSIYYALTKDIEFTCHLNNPKNKYYAETLPNTSYKINIGKLFWTLTKSTNRLQEGILLHEVTHFDDITNFTDYETDDYIVSFKPSKYEDVKEFAKNHPDNAIKNAVNYEFFAVNKPFLSTGCFTDTDTNTLYIEEICKLKDWDIIKGYDDGSFKPNNPITRAEFIKMILLVQYNYDNIIQNSFTIELPDVSIDDWFAEYVSFAYNKGFIKGYDDGEFKPNNSITFAEASKIIIKILDSNLDLDLILNSNLDLNMEEKDCRGIEKCHWADNFMTPIKTLAPLSEGFDANKPLFRGQLAYILIQIKKRIGN